MEWRWKHQCMKWCNDDCWAMRKGTTENISELQVRLPTWASEIFSVVLLPTASQPSLQTNNNNNNNRIDKTLQKIIGLPVSGIESKIARNFWARLDRYFLSFSCLQTEKKSNSSATDENLNITQIIPQEINIPMNKKLLSEKSSERKVTFWNKNVSHASKQETSGNHFFLVCRGL